MPTNGMNSRQAAGACSSKRLARADTATAIERIFGDSGVYSSVPPRRSEF
jgi:hypothetical protein